MKLEKLINELKAGVIQREEWNTSDLFEQGYLEAMREFIFDLERVKESEGAK